MFLGVGSDTVPFGCRGPQQEPLIDETNILRYVFGLPFCCRCPHVRFLVMPAFALTGMFFGDACPL